jgi:hypothetical protein
MKGPKKRCGMTFVVIEQGSTAEGSNNMTGYRELGLVNTVQMFQRAYAGNSQFLRTISSTWSSSRQ